MMTSKPIWLLSLLVIAMPGLTMTSQTEHVTLNTAVRVLQALSEYFRSDCLLGVVSGELQSDVNVTRLCRMTSSELLAIALVSTTTWFGASLNCDRPLNFLMSGEGQVSSDLSQLSRNGHISRQVWLLFLEERQSLENVFLDIYIPFDCQFLVAQPSGGDLLLYEVYQIAKNWPLRSELFGSWSAAKGLTAPKGGLYTRRVSLQGLTLKTTNVHDPPLSTLSVVNGSLVLGGFYGSIWALLEKGMNFKSVHGVPKEGGNKYSEMFQQVVSGEADATSTCVGHTRERDLAADFTAPLSVIPFRVFLAEPTGHEVKWSDVTSPFSGVLWLALLGTTLTAATLLSLIHRVLRRLAQPSGDDYPLADAIFLLFGSVFCQQGHHQTPQSTPCRIVFIVVFWMGIIVMNTYSATLISYLTVFIRTLPFNTMEGLYANKDFAFGVINNSMSHIQLKSAESGILKLLNDRHVRNRPLNTPATYLEGFQRACVSRFAFVALSELLTVERDRLNCSIVYLPQPFSTYTASLALPKGSPYRGLFNHNLMKLYAGGFITKLYKMAIQDRRPSSPADGVPSISLATVAPILSVLASGIVLASVVLIVERLLKLRQTGKKHAESENMQLRKTIYARNVGKILANHVGNIGRITLNDDEVFRQVKTKNAESGEYETEYAGLNLRQTRTKCGLAPKNDAGHEEGVIETKYSHAKNNDPENARNIGTNYSRASTNHTSSVGFVGTNYRQVQENQQRVHVVTESRFLNRSSILGAHTMEDNCNHHTMQRVPNYLRQSLDMVDRTDWME